MPVSETVNRALENGVKTTVERATSGFFGWLWGIATSLVSITFWGGIIAFVADFFFPQLGIRQWISDTFESLGLGRLLDQGLASLSPETAEGIARFTERYVPWVGESIAGRIRNAPRAALAQMDDAGFETTMRDQTGVPEIAQALVGVRQQFNRFLDTNRTLDPRRLTSKEGITALLNSDDGRAVVGAILTGYERARAPSGSIATRAANTPASAMETQLPAALRQIVADQATFTQIMQNQQNRALIYRAAPLAAGAGISIQNGRAFSQHLSAALERVSFEDQRRLFLELGDPDKAAGAMMRLYYNPRVPSAALTGMAQSITVADSAPEELRQNIRVLQSAASNPQQFQTQRRTVQEVGQETVAGLLNPQRRIVALAEAAMRLNNPINGEQIAALMGPAESSTPAEPPINQLLRDKQHADNVLSFIRAVGAPEFQRLAGQIVPAPASPATGAATTTQPSAMATAFLDIFRDERRTGALISLHSTLGAENFNRLVGLMGRPALPVREMAALVGTLALPQQQALVRFVENLPDGQQIAAGINSLITLPQPQQQALTTILPGLPDGAIDRLLPLLGGGGNQLNFERMMTLLMDDEIRRGLTGKEAALSALLTPRLPPAMQAFATPQNLAATLRLVNAIDTNTGSGTDAEAERAADSRNAGVIELLMNLAQGNRSALQGQDVAALGRAIAEVMREQTHVVAFRQFLRDFNTNGLTPDQRRIFGMLEQNWWNDVIPDGIFQPRRQGQGDGNILHPSYGDGGLAAFLANPDSARILLELMRNPQPKDLIPNINTATSLGMMEALTWGQWGQGWLSSWLPSYLVSPPEPTLHPDLADLQRVLIPSVAPASATPPPPPR